MWTPSRFVVRDEEGIFVVHKTGLVVCDVERSVFKVFSLHFLFLKEKVTP